MNKSHQKNMSKQNLATLCAAVLLAVNAPGAVTITDSFSFSGDLAVDPAYTSSPGSDGGGADAFGVDKPITIGTTGFASAGTDKLVGVISMHNSAARTSLLTSLTFGSVDITSNIVSFHGSGGGDEFSKQYVFYVDAPTFAAGSDIVFGLDATYNVDEVSFALFALDNVATGHLGLETSDTSTTAPITVSAGDLVLGITQRNNGGVPVASGSYTNMGFNAGNLKSGVAYLTATSDGAEAPVFSTGIIATTIAFEAATIPEPSSLSLLALTATLFVRRRR